MDHPLLLKLVMFGMNQTLEEHFVIMILSGLK
jgi:hypothetical protein